MPQLNSSEEVVKVYLPSTKDAEEADKAWVEIDVSPYKTKDITGVNQDMTGTEIALSTMVSRIKGWNFTSDGTPEGTLVPINTETVELLDIKDFTYLQSQIKAGKDLTDDEKKASSESSQPDATATTIPVQSQ